MVNFRTLDRWYINEDEKKISITFMTLFPMSYVNDKINVNVNLNIKLSETSECNNFISINNRNVLKTNEIISTKFKNEMIERYDKYIEQNEDKLESTNLETVFITKPNSLLSDGSFMSVRSVLDCDLFGSFKVTVSESKEENKQHFHAELLSVNLFDGSEIDNSILHEISEKATDNEVLSEEDINSLTEYLGQVYRFLNRKWD